MRRRVFDVLASAAGLVLVVVLAVAGGLALWGYNFANSNVHDQLAQQQITFPGRQLGAGRQRDRPLPRPVRGPAVDHR